MANKLSKRYLKAKEQFLKIENPTKKIDRLWDEEKKAWEAYSAASKLSQEYTEIYVIEKEKYDLAIKKVSDTLTNWADRNDWIDVRYPGQVGVGDFPF